MRCFLMEMGILSMETTLCDAPEFTPAVWLKVAMTVSSSLHMAPVAGSTMSMPAIIPQDTRLAKYQPLMPAFSGMV